MCTVETVLPLIYHYSSNVQRNCPFLGLLHRIAIRQIEVFICNTKKCKKNKKLLQMLHNNKNKHLSNNSRKKRFFLLKKSLKDHLLRYQIYEKI